MDLSIRQGETLEINVKADDDSAETVRLVARNTGNIIKIDETATFSTVDGKRVATIRTQDTNHAVGDYKYMLTIEYEDGYIEKLPDADCEVDCDLPVIKICEAIDLEVS